MTEAGWTRTKPTVAGWYWTRARPNAMATILYFDGRSFGRMDKKLATTFREYVGPLSPDSFQQGRVAAFKEVEQRFDSMFGATDRRIDSVRDYRVDKFYTWLVQQAQERGVGDDKV